MINFLLNYLLFNDLLFKKVVVGVRLSCAVDEKQALSLNKKVKLLIRI